LTSFGIERDKMNLSVGVFSDVICPWCFIGKRRLEKAIAAYGGAVKIRWHPFQLNPTMPKEGIIPRSPAIGGSPQSNRENWLAPGIF
jgi:predicted DsbA family dithiol-disulfide isomerase